jgi:hypothetical protein
MLLMPIILSDVALEIYQDEKKALLAFYCQAGYLLF